MVRHFPHAMDVTLFNEACFENIFRPPDDFGDAFAFFDAENSGQRFVLDRDCGYRFRKEMPLTMGEQQDRLFWMVDDSVRQARLIFADQRDTILPGNILGGNDKELLPIDAASKSDVFDVAAWNGAADSGAIKHVGQGPIVDVESAPSDLVVAFLARNRPADNVAVSHAVVAPATSAPASCERDSEDRRNSRPRG